MIVKKEYVNYKKETIDDYFYSEELKFKEYDTLSIKQYLDWYYSVLNNHPDLNANQILIDVNVYEEAEGFGYGYTVIHLVPYIERLETNEEYAERISKEEAEYNKMVEAERLMQEESLQYQKDMEELKRIKEKYNM